MTKLSIKAYNKILRAIALVMVIAFSAESCLLAAPQEGFGQSSLLQPDMFSDKDGLRPIRAVEQTGNADFETQLRQELSSWFSPELIRDDIIIGVPRETKEEEGRVGLTPQGVRILKKLGVKTIRVESGAGVLAGFTNKDYEDAGAILCDTQGAWGTNFIIKVKEPLPAEYKYICPDQTIFTYFHLASKENRKLTEGLMEQKLGTAVAYETIEVEGKTPLLAPMSEIAGILAAYWSGFYMLYCGDLLQKPASVDKYSERLTMVHSMHLENAKKIIPTFFPNVPLSELAWSSVEGKKAVVLGGGIVGSNAALMLARMGAEVTITEPNAQRKEELEEIFEGQGMGEHIRVVQTANAEDIKTELLQADIIAGGVYLKGQKAPLLIPEQLLKEISAQRRKVIVDVSVDQGGNIFGSNPTYYTDPVFVDNVGNIRFCVANMPAILPRHASIALEHAKLKYVVAIMCDLKKATEEYPELKGGINVRNGIIVLPEVAQAHQKQLNTLKEVSGGLAADGERFMAEMEDTGVNIADVVDGMIIPPDAPPAFDKTKAAPVVTKTTQPYDLDGKTWEVFIIGAGYIGPKYLYSLQEATGNNFTNGEIRMAGIVDLNRDNLKAAIAEFRDRVGDSIPESEYPVAIEGDFNDNATYDAILQASKLSAEQKGNIIVIVAARDEHHLKVVQKLAERGIRYMVVEKPVGCTPDEIQQMIKERDKERGEDRHICEIVGQSQLPYSLTWKKVKQVMEDKGFVVAETVQSWRKFRKRSEDGIGVKRKSDGTQDWNILNFDLWHKLFLLGAIDPSLQDGRILFTWARDAIISERRFAFHGEGGVVLTHKNGIRSLMINCFDRPGRRIDKDKSVDSQKVMCLIGVNGDRIVIEFSGREEYASRIIYITAADTGAQPEEYIVNENSTSVYGASLVNLIHELITEQSRSSDHSLETHLAMARLVEEAVQQSETKAASTGTRWNNPHEEYADVEETVIKSKRHLWKEYQRLKEAGGIAARNLDALEEDLRTLAESI